MPKVSVIMPVYNTREEYLRQAIESVLAQSFTDFELVIINDHSSNDTHLIIQEYMKRERRIRYINHNSNEGLSISRNDGIAISDGDLIAFLDSDDFYAPDFLKYLIEVLEQTNADVVGCDFQKIYSTGEYIKNISKITPKIYKNPLDILLHKDNFVHFNVWNKLYKKVVIGDIRFVPGIYYEDWVFNCCVFAKISSFAWIKEILCGYRISNNSIMRSEFTQKKLEDYIKGIEIVYHFYQSNYPFLWSKVKRTRISRTVKMLMNSTLRSQNEILYQEAKEHLQRLYQRNLIGYSGLSFINKLKLFKFLCMGK